MVVCVHMHVPSHWDSISLVPRLSHAVGETLHGIEATVTILYHINLKYVQYHGYSWMLLVGCTTTTNMGMRLQ